MTLLLDTDVVVDYLYGRPAAVAVITEMRSRGLSISTITLMEILEGIEGGQSPERARRGFRSFLRRTRVLVVSQAIAARAATIRLDLRRNKRQVSGRTLDIIVAATALEHGLMLLTRNRRDYDDIAGLRLYDNYPADLGE